MTLKGQSRRRGLSLAKLDEINRDRLHAEVRKLGSEHVFLMLEDALELLPAAKLRKLAKKYLDLERLRPDAEKAAGPRLRAAVKLFEKSSLAGEYYESFFVDSRNYREQSAGTSAWIAEYRRLLDRCLADATKSDPAEVREAMDVLFGLLNHIDEGHDDVIFFADEGGSWQVGVDWAKVLPIWFVVLSATAEPLEYAERITALLSRHYSYGRDKMLAVARRTATTDQRKAFTALATATTGSLLL
jgi:hypothetical protein